MLNEAGVKLNQTKAELDAERQRSARAAALENKATTYEQQVVALQQQLASTQQSLQTMSSRAATQSGPSREDMDRVQQEWLDKYRLLEQDNLRLRDRTMRVEGMLDEMQQQRAAAANAARPGQLRPVDSALMAGVATLPWLAEKQDDEDFDMGRGRGGMMQEDGNAALRLKFMARRLVRRVAREVDVQR